MSKRNFDEALAGEATEDSEVSDLRTQIAQLTRQLEESKRLAEAERLRAEAERLRAEAERLRAEEERLRAEAERLRAESTESIQKGTFFATYDELWTPNAVKFSKDDFNSLIRAKYPHFKTRKASVPYPCEATLKEAEKPTCFIKNDQKSARTSHNGTEAKETIWPIHLMEEGASCQPKGDFQHPVADDEIRATEAAADHRMRQVSPGMQHVAPDMQTTSLKDDSPLKQEQLHDHSQGQEETGHSVAGDIAHLLPASPLHASLYYNVALWIFGESIKQANAEVLQKIIHGSAPGSGAARRIMGTGLKHMICNKIRMGGQKEYYDNHPCVLIVPLLSLRQAKEWKGEGYSAMFIISRGDKEKGQKLSDVASSVMLRAGEHATDEELALACSLLSSVVRGLAYSLKQRVPSQNNPEAHALTDKHMDLLKKLRGNFTVPTGDPNMVVAPKRNQNCQKPVRKIYFCSASVESDVELTGHPAPDPLLLTVKAAVNWSKYHGQPLLAGGENTEECSDDEQSLQAMDEYLELREQSQRAKRDQEIPGMTIHTVSPK